MSEVQEAQDRFGLEGKLLSDRIEVRLVVPAERLEWAQRHAGLIAGEVLAVVFDVVSAESDSGAIELGDGVTADITKADA